MYIIEIIGEFSSRITVRCPPCFAQTLSQVTLAERCCANSARCVECRQMAKAATVWCVAGVYGRRMWQFTAYGGSSTIIDAERRLPVEDMVVVIRRQVR